MAGRAVRLAGLCDWPGCVAGRLSARWTARVAGGRNDRRKQCS